MEDYEDQYLFPITQDELLLSRINKLEKKIVTVQGGLFSRYCDLEKKYFEALERILFLEQITNSRSKLVTVEKDQPSKALRA